MVSCLLGYHQLLLMRPTRRRQRSGPKAKRARRGGSALPEAAPPAAPPPTPPASDGSDAGTPSECRKASSGGGADGGGRRGAQRARHALRAAEGCGTLRLSRTSAHRRTARAPGLEGDAARSGDSSRRASSGTGGAPGLWGRRDGVSLSHNTVVKALRRKREVRSVLDVPCCAPVALCTMQDLNSRTGTVGNS